METTKKKQSVQVMLINPSQKHSKIPGLQLTLDGTTYSGFRMGDDTDPYAFAMFNMDLPYEDKEEVAEFFEGLATYVRNSISLEKAS